jgi:hypothetical protein
MFANGFLPSICLLIASWYILPESPHWFCSKSRVDEALEVLKKIRETNKEVEAELEETIKAKREEPSNDGKQLATLDSNK